MEREEKESLDCWYGGPSPAKLEENKFKPGSRRVSGRAKCAGGVKRERRWLGRRPGLPSDLAISSRALGGWG